MFCIRRWRVRGIPPMPGSLEDKLKIFSRSGLTLFSTDSKDIGNINKERYFQEIVAKGKVYTEVVAKDTESLEGWKVTADVLEAYVPLVRNDNFIGAFEIYYDITTRKNQLDSLLAHSTTILLALAVCLLVAFIVIF